MASFHQHYSTYTLQTYHHQDHQFRSWPTQMTSPSHLHTHAQVQQRNGQNKLTLNPDKTACTLFTPEPAEYKSNLDLNINNTALYMATHPVLGLTLDPKLTYSTHKPLQMIKALTAPGWGKQKETLMATYKAVMRSALEYASSIWSPLASSTSINKLQDMQNAALRTYSSMRHNKNKKHIIHHTPYSNIQPGWSRQSFFLKTISAWDGLAFAEAPSLAVFRSIFFNN